MDRSMTTQSGSSSLQMQQRRRHDRAAPHSADWSHLPTPALLCVCGHLPDLAAFFAFAGTCKEWRDVANFGRKAFMAAQPPLLCTTDGERFYSPVNARCYKNRRVAAVVRRRRGTIMDVSQGYLVIEADSGAPMEKKIVLLNPITQHRVGSLPRLFADFVSWVILTAPPTSPDCVAVACSSLRLPRQWTWGRHDHAPCTKDLVDYARPGDAGWTPFGRETDVLGTYKPVASSDGKIYAWAADRDDDDRFELVAMEFPRGEEPKLTRLRTFAVDSDWDLYPVCLGAESRSRGGGDHQLLLVRASFVSPDGSNSDVKNGTIEIYRLEDSSEQVQKSIDGLIGGRALVMDYYSCRVAGNPAGWGGRGGDVYFSVGYGSEAWRLRLRDGAGSTAASNHYYAPWPAADQKRSHSGVLWVLPADTCS